MHDEKSYVTETCEAALLVYLRMQKLAALLPHSPGCIVWKGQGKRYPYWQIRENGRQKHRYVKKEELEGVRKRIREMQGWLKKLQELRAYFRKLKRILKVLGSPWESVLAKYELARRGKREEQARREAAQVVANSKKYSSNYRHMTDKGDMVASKSEVLIADTLFALGIDYEYEKEYRLSNGQVVKPDFTIRKKNGDIVFWEHAGLPDDPDYMAKHEWKVREYEKCGFTRSKNLILTFDKNGALSSAEIRRMIELYELN